MIVHPNKFQAMIISKPNVKLNNTQIKLNGNNISLENSVKLLGVKIDNKLKFDLHIKEIVAAAAKQLNALFRLKGYLSIKKRRTCKQFHLLKF